MAKVNVTLDDKSKRILKQMRRELPSKEVNAGLNKIMREELKRIRKATVKEASANTGLLPKFLNKMSGAKSTRKQGVFWIVARNFILHRLGNVYSTSRGKDAGVRAKGRTLKKIIRADDKTFQVRKAALRRSGGEIRPFFASTRSGILSAFRANVGKGRINIAKALEREMIVRINGWHKKVTR